MQFNRWKFTDLVHNSTLAKCFLASISFGATVLLTCRMRDPAAEQRANAYNKAQDILPVEAVATAATSSRCDQESLLETEFSGMLKFGPLQDSIKVRLKNLTANNTVDVVVNDLNMTLDVGTLKLSPIDVQALCSISANKPAPLTAASPFITGLMERLAPDCRLETDSSGNWDCRGQPGMLLEAQNTLRDLEIQVLNRWTRHPYLLTRRFTVTKQLLRTIQSESITTKEKNLCLLAKVSLVQELPLALRSNRARELLCHENTDREVRTMLVAAAAKELKALAAKFMQESRTGALTIQIPNRDLSSRRDFWVSLQPVPYTPSAAEVSAQGQTMQAYCWHPVFGIERDLIAVADHLQLIASNPHSKCATIPAAKAGEDSQRYIATSVTSESEFIISYGKSKLLRLPEGSYQYVVKRQRNLFESGYQSDEPNVSQGTISWKQPITRTIIK